MDTEFESTDRETFEKEEEESSSYEREGFDDFAIDRAVNEILDLDMQGGDAEWPCTVLQKLHDMNDTQNTVGHRNIFVTEVRMVLRKLLEDSRTGPFPATPNYSEAEASVNINTPPRVSRLDERPFPLAPVKPSRKRRLDFSPEVKILKEPPYLMESEPEDEARDKAARIIWDLTSD